jgi:hypothetical protein
MNEETRTKNSSAASADPVSDQSATKDGATDTKAAVQSTPKRASNASTAAQPEADAQPQTAAAADSKAAEVPSDSATADSKTEANRENAVVQVAGDAAAAAKKNSGGDPGDSVRERLKDSGTNSIAGSTGSTKAAPAVGSTGNTEETPVVDAGERSQRTKELVQTSDRLKSVAPNSYQAWRSQADLLLQAIKQLERREIDPDESVILIGVRLVENDLRDAAEQALRHCAHFATTFDERIALIDEANSVRRTTWF